MFDIGWTELLVIAIVLIVVVGPKDLPPMLRAFGKMTANLRKMAGEFRTQFDEALRESELDDVRQTISDAQRLNPTNALREAINPLRQMGQDIKADLQRATQVPSPVMTPADPAATQTDVEAQQAIEGTPPGEPSPEVPVSFPSASVSSLATPASVPAATPAPVGQVAAAATSTVPVAAQAAVTEQAVVKPRAPRKTAAKAKPVPETASVPAAEAPKPKRSRAAVKPAQVAQLAEEPAVKAPARKRATKKTDVPKDDA